jgi:hypothetical protein
MQEAEIELRKAELEHEKNKAAKEAELRELQMKQMTDLTHSLFNLVGNLITNNKNNNNNNI